MTAKTDQQWRNSCPPPTLLSRKFLLTYWEKRGKEKRENGENSEGKSKKGRWKIEIHFSKPLKFVLGLPKWEFSTVKKYFTLEKNLEK